MENNYGTNLKYLKCNKSDLVENLLWWQKRGLQFTASGYGSKIPTTWIIKHNNRNKRIYCAICSNIGTLYIKNGKDKLILDVDESR